MKLMLYKTLGTVSQTPAGRWALLGLMVVMVVSVGPCDDPFEGM